MKRRIVLTAAVVLIAMIGVTIVILTRTRVRLAVDTNDGWTIHYLRNWAQRICFIQQTDETFNCSRYESANDLYDDLLKRLPVGFVWEEERNDGWGHPFVLTHNETETAKQIKIISKGSNGVFENGGGDDIWVEMIFFDDGRFVTKGNDPNLVDLQDRFPAAEWKKHGKKAGH